MKFLPTKNKNIGLWYLLPFSIREKLEAPNRYDARKELEIILKNSANKKLSVLDAGAGDCFAKKFFVNTNYEYTAMDMDNKEAKIDVVGDVQNLPFEKNKFDIVLCLEVLEHVSEPQLALKELFRVLKKGGVLLLSVPLMAVGFHNDFYRFTHLSLKMMLENVGFKIKKIRPIGGYFRMLGWQFSKLSYLIKKPKNKIFWPFYFLVKIPVGLVFQIIIPFILFHLDRLDKEKTETCGYVAVVIK